MFIVDPNRLYEAMKEKGFKTIGELAKYLGVHRNTIHHYLSGHGVFPENFEKIIETLGLKPADILVKKIQKEISPLEKIAPIVDDLHKNFPDVTFVLFGSRARGRAGKYSDWDIGVYSAKGLVHEEYRSIVRRKEDLIENLPFFVDIVNLNRADKDFLNDAGKGWIFLTGRCNDWVELQRKAVA